MRKLKGKLGFALVALMALAVTGCILSGTFVNTKMYYNFGVSSSDFYYAYVDVTTEEEWEDHKDDIKDIDNVGFELWITNNRGVANTMTAYVAATSSALDGSSAKTEVETHATEILEVSLAAAGQTFIPYWSSFSHISHLETLKKLAESGKFKFFALSDSSPVDFNIDSVKVIITFTAGK